jgi:hypothetical protein
MDQGQYNKNPVLVGFGDYVATRQLAVEQNTVIYRARRHDSPLGEKSENHVIVLFLERKARVETESENANVSLEKDLQLQFLDTVKQQKKAYESGVKNLAPVRDFGLGPQGAWYATDYYPRGFLKKWITQRAGVSEQELRHIIGATVRSLLALQRDCKRSHGNLGSSSILIGGKIGAPLRGAPILLTFLKPGDASDSDNFERSDLKALGLIVYQLVCRQDASPFNADIYPIPTSECWAQLGPQGDYWRGLCNRLLDPALTLKKMSLVILASELPPPARSSMGLAVGAAALVLLGAGGLLFWMHFKTPQVAPKTIPSHPIPALVETPGKSSDAGNSAVAMPVETNAVPVTPASEAAALGAPMPDKPVNPVQASYSPPVLVGITDRSVKPGTPAVRYPFQVKVDDSMADRLFVVGVSSNPSFLPDASLKIEGSGAERVLIIDPVPQKSGEVILAISVADGRTNATQTFWFKVAP